MTRLWWAIVDVVQSLRKRCPHAGVRRALFRVEWWAYQHALGDHIDDCRGFWWVP
jgi:hypothetical protein